MGIEFGVAGIVALIVIALGFFIWMTSSFYKCCPPNTAMIVSGMLTADPSAGEGSAHKVVIGGGTIVFPVIQHLGYLSLEAMAIELDPKTPYITKDGTPIKFRAIAQVKVKPDPVSVMTAAELFLDKTPNLIAERIAEIIIGHTRSIAGTMSYNEILKNLNSFSQSVMEASLTTLMKQGMTVVSYSIDEMDNDPAQLQSLIFEQAMKAQA